MARKEPLPSVVLIDSREQTPLSFEWPTEVIGLKTGDYSLKNYEQIICVERKSLQDIVACCGHQRERFEREIERMLEFPSRLLLIESTISQIMLKRYRGEIHPNSVIGSILGWMERGILMLFTGNHANASMLCQWYLKIAARHRQSLCSSLKIAT